MDPAADRASGRIHHTRLGRAVLSALFGFNFLAIGVYLLPVDRQRYDVLPERLREPAIRVVAPIIYNLSPITDPWLNATWTRQNWQLFAPEPSAWNVQGEIIAWFPSSPRAFDPAVRWSSDTIPLPTGERDPYPHFGRGREYRVALDLAETGRGQFLQRWYAAALCRRLRDDEGLAPDGVEIRVFWSQILPPWASNEDADDFVQSIGGFNCWELEGRARPWWSIPTPDLRGLPSAHRTAFERDPR